MKADLDGLPSSSIIAQSLEVGISNNRPVVHLVVTGKQRGASSLGEWNIVLSVPDAFHLKGLLEEAVGDFLADVVDAETE